MSIARLMNIVIFPDVKRFYFAPFSSLVGAFSYGFKTDEMFKYYKNNTISSKCVEYLKFISKYQMIMAICSFKILYINEYTTTKKGVHYE
ncbi:hypothetical protein D3C78_1698480 [compost metagenome]